MKLGFWNGYGKPFNVGRSVGSIVAVATVPDRLNSSPSTLYLTELFSNDTEARIITPPPDGVSWGSARSVLSKSSGKFYIEHRSFFDNVPNGAMVGLGLSSLTPAQAGNNNNWVAGIISTTMAYYKRLAIDLSAGKAWYAISASGDWASGDPVTGTSPSWTFAPGEYSVYARPQTIVDSYGTLEARVTINFGATPFDFSAPTGYGIWGQ